MSSIQSFQLHGNFFILPKWYVFWKPIRQKYDNLRSSAAKDGVSINSSWFLESPVIFGKSWFGAQVNESELNNPRLVHSHHIVTWNKDCEAVDIPEYVETDIIKDIMKSRPLATTFLKQRLVEPSYNSQGEQITSRIIFW